MKILLGYHIWCRADMLAYLLDGIVENFDPGNTELAFVLDAPKDGTDQAFEHMESFWLEHRGFKFYPYDLGYETAPRKPFKYTVFKPDKEVREVGGHNILLRHFVERTDCDVLVAPQDDERFNRPIHAEVQRVLEAYGPSLGIIGSRDGYSVRGEPNLASSFWSRSEAPLPDRRTWLKHGEFVERDHMNSGPISYPRHVVGRVGYLDEGFTAWCVWEDYGQRCVDAGLKNVVLGLDVTHAQFGRKQHSWFYDAVDGKPYGYTGRDDQRYRDKHDPKDPPPK
jgi:hypothetical protein